MNIKKIIYIVNVDWYFFLHWVERASYFKSQGYEIHVLCTTTDLKYSLKSKELGFILHDLKLIRSSVNIFNEIRTCASIFNVINKVRPSLIHSITIKPNIYTGLINKFFKIPIVYAITGTGAVFSSKNIKFKLLRFFIVALYRINSTSFSRFVFENNSDYHLFRSLSIVRKNGAVILGAGIDIKKYSYSKPPYNNTVLFAARLLKDKGFYTFVEAAKKLKSNGYDFTFKVAGIIDQDVIDAISLNDIYKLHDDGVIDWLGQIDDMKSLISSCDIVCLPTSYGEGIPRILIEASSCGRSIIATDVPGCSDLIKDGINGFLIRINDSDELADAILTLLNNHELSYKFGFNGRKFVENNLTQELVFSKTESVYDSLLL